jgi:hypothetical protein
LFAVALPSVAAPARCGAVDGTAVNAAALDGASQAPAEQDSTDGGDTWLPVPEEDLETTEPLEEERAPVRPGALLRGVVMRGQFRLRRIGVLDERRGARGELGFLVDERRFRPGARLTVGGERLVLAGGRVSVTQGPALFAEAMRVTRGGRRVRRPRTSAVRAQPSLGASAGALDGGAFTWNGPQAIWAFAGFRSETREPIGGVGLGVSRGRIRAAAALGAELRARAAGAETGGGASSAPPSRCGSITVVRRAQGGSVALEALGCREGRALLAEVGRRGGDVFLSARWRYRSWTARQVAAELSAETIGSASRARVTWRSWSGSATADDGLLELEVTRSRGGGAPLRLRVGTAGFGREGNRLPALESYGLADATLARDDRRSLAVHVLRRGSRNAGSSASSTTFGSRLDLRMRTLGRHSVLVEATRIRKDASAWGVELTPSGETTLRTRSKPGLWVSARGGFGPRLWRFGYALERGEDSGGARPWSGTLWLRLTRS